MKVSVVTVNYNNSAELEETLKSVVAQEYRNIEHIIVDGSSTDGTIEIVEQYAEKHPEIKWISEPDNGIYYAMNKGLKMVTGEVIYFLNSGDILFDRDVLGKVVKEFEKSHADFIFGDIVEVYETQKTKRKYWNVSKLFLYGHMICHQACFFRKSLVDKVGFFNESFKIAADYEYLLKIFDNNEFKRKHLAETVVFYDKSGVSCKNVELLVSERNILKEKYFNKFEKFLVRRKLLRWYYEFRGAK